MELKQHNRELDQAERDKRKQMADVGNKDLKLNKALEELDRVKGQLREAKVNEQGKSEGARRDMEKLVEDNRKLERQRNELMQAFKKQMRLIDILKR